MFSALLKIAYSSGFLGLKDKVRKMDLAISLAVGLGTAAALWKLFFADLDDFLECISYWLKPDLWSWYKGEATEDWWAELKLAAWLLISVGVGFGLYRVLQ